MRSGSVPLGGLRSGELIFFTSYALAGLTLPVSSFFFTLLENYGLQLHHLVLHSFTLVAIFVHHCEMYVEVLLLVRLFQLFHILHSSERSAPPWCLLLPAQEQGSSCVHRPLTPGKWDRWRDDWVIVQDDAHDRLELPTAAPTGSRFGWEKVPDL
jgi:hypothetical protein